MLVVENGEGKFQRKVPKRKIVWTGGGEKTNFQE